MGSSQSDLRSFTNFEQLPNDMIREICSKMSVGDLNNMVQTSEKMHNICIKIYHRKYRDEIIQSIKSFQSDKDYVTLTNNSTRVKIGKSVYDPYRWMSSNTNIIGWDTDTDLSMDDFYVSVIADPNSNVIFENENQYKDLISVSVGAHGYFQSNYLLDETQLQNLLDNLIEKGYTLKTKYDWLFP